MINKNEINQTTPTPAPTSVDTLSDNNTKLEELLKKAEELKNKRKTEEDAQNYAKILDQVTELSGKMSNTISSLGDKELQSPLHTAVLDKSTELMAKIGRTEVSSNSPQTDNQIPRGTLKTDDTNITKQNDGSFLRIHTIKCNPEDKDIAKQAIETVMKKNGIHKGPNGNYPIPHGSGIFSNSISASKTKDYLKEIDIAFKQLYAKKHGAENITGHKEQPNEPTTKSSNIPTPKH